MPRIEIGFVKPGDALWKEMDKAMVHKRRRMDVLTRYAKKHPDKFFNHVNRVIARVTKKEFRQYASKIKAIGEQLTGEDGKYFREHGKSLTANANGIAAYLKLKIEHMEYFAIAEAAGIEPSKIKTLIQVRADIMYIKGGETKKIYSPKDAVSNKIFGGMKPNTIAPITTIPNPKGKDYGAVLKFVQYKDEGTQIDIHYTVYEEYERAVYDAVASIVKEYGVPTIITSEQIYRLTTQNPKARLTAQAAKDIETAMINCGRGEVTIVTDPAGDAELWKKAKDYDLEPEQKRYNVSSKYYGRMITFSAASSGDFGGTLDRWTIFEIPILYNYAHDKRQIAETPIEQPKTDRSRARTSKDTQSMESYITRRIDTMKKDKKMRRDILWENLYKIDGATTGKTTQAIRVKQSRTRAKAVKILDKCVDRGLIKGYTYKDNEHMKLVGKNRQYHSIGIVF